MARVVDRLPYNLYTIPIIVWVRQRKGKKGGKNREKEKIKL